MLPYYVMVGIPLFYSFFSYLAQRELQNKKKNYEIIIFFVIYFIILALRDDTVGIDLKNYFYYFQKFGNMRWQELMNVSEFGFSLLSKLIYVSTKGNFHSFLAIVAAIVCIPTAYLYEKESEDCIISILLYINATSLFVMNFSGLRQAIAITFAVPAYYAVKNKKIFKFILFVFLASLFHSSAWIMLAMYPIYRIKVDIKKMIFILTPIIIFVFAFRTQIFNFLLTFLSEKYQERYGNTTATGAVMMILLIGLFVVFSFIFIDEEKITDDINGLRVFLIFSFVLQLFSTIHYTAMRFNYYFLLFLPLTVTKVMKNSRKQNENIMLIIKTIFIIFFTFYFFYSAYTDEDILQVFPYKSYL